MTKLKKRRKKAAPPLTDEEMSRLSIKPHWWVERQIPIEITGYKLPFGIEAEAIHQGIRYSGVLYPVEVSSEQEKESSH